MPPLAVAAGIGAVGAIGSAAIGSSASKKAAKTQANATTAQINAANANRDYQYNLNAPTIGRGSEAEGTIAALLGLGGDATAASKAFDTYKGSTGYATRLAEGLGAVNTSRFAGGSGQSGATLKALLRYGQGIASNEFGNYLGQLGGLQAAGANARGLVANVGSNATNQFINASQNGANAQTGYIMSGAQNAQSAIQNLVNAGLYAYGSSYGNKGTASPLLHGLGGSTGGY